MLRRISRRTTVRLHVVLPTSAKVPAELPRGERRHGDASVVVRDTVNGHAIDFERVVDLPAGRIEPGDDYAVWEKFVRDADLLISRDVLVGK